MCGVRNYLRPKTICWSIRIVIKRGFHLLSVAEYLRREETAPVKHEYVAGELYSLAGASRRHNRVAMNIAAALLAASKGGPCRVSISDIRLQATDDVYYYPDVMVACGPEPADPMSENAPCLVVEVTSPSTQAIDVREKTLIYKRIRSVQAYLIVHQDERRIQRHWRDANGEWHYDVATGAAGVPVPCPEIELTLDAVYEGTGVPA